MSTPAVTASAPVAVPSGRRELHGAARFARRHPVIAGEVVLIVLILLVSLAAPLLGFGDPNHGDLLQSVAKPGTSGHLLGTDVQGRDILTRVVFSIRTSVLISLAATVAALLLGLGLGLLAGTVRWLDTPIMRLVDIQMAFPALVLAIAVVAALGGASIVNVVVVLTVTGWVGYARVCRAMVLSLRNALFVDAARAAGATSTRIAWRHLAPNVLPTLVAMAVAQFPMLMIQEASLSYLGLGVPASTPTLGVMMQDGQQALFTAWWPCVEPAIVMAVLVLILTSLGDYASRALNRT
ncbi:MAG TPA: ABC transporter permease [Baekduia sp.]|jgi:peptide/nickel transport system permease protein